MTVKFSYYYGEMKTAESKVFAVCNRRFPSGLRKCFKVLNNDRGIYEWIKADACKII